MKKIAIYLLLFFAIVACNTKNKFTINGELADKTYDGEWIYLVPMVNAPVERVDSTVIKNGKFTFEAKVDSPEIYIIRGRPLIRLSVQELLVVKEPGVVSARLNHDSWAGGTALNDSLQEWKVQKNFADSLMTNLREQFMTLTDSVQRNNIKQKADSLRTEVTNFNFNFIQNNKTNVVGELVYKMSKNGFSPDQIHALGLEK